MDIKYDPRRDLFSINGVEFNFCGLILHMATVANLRDGESLTTVRDGKNAVTRLNPPDERVPHDATCSGCRWWAGGPPSLSAWCRRNPPLMTREQDPQGVQVAWPRTRPDMICGDWEPKGGE